MGTRICIPSGALGLGYDAIALDRAIAAKPDLIAIDGGSTDSGPSYLGRGVSKYARESTRIEWQGLIEARAKAGCPLVIGTAGTCGTDSTVDWLYEITVEVLADLGLSAKIARLYSEQDPEKIAQTPLTPLAAAPAVDAGIIKSCTHIVALAGAEQINAALSTGADIIIAGRTTDTAIIAAPATGKWRSRRRGLARRQSGRMRSALCHKPAIGRDPGGFRRRGLHRHPHGRRRACSTPYRQRPYAL